MAKSTDPITQELDGLLAQQAALEARHGEFLAQGDHGSANHSQSLVDRLQPRITELRRMLAAPARIAEIEAELRGIAARNAESREEIARLANRISELQKKAADLAGKIYAYRAAATDAAIVGGNVKVPPWLGDAEFEHHALESAVDSLLRKKAELTEELNQAPQRVVELKTAHIAAQHAALQAEAMRAITGIRQALLRANVARKRAFPYSDPNILEIHFNNLEVDAELARQAAALNSLA